MDLNQYVCGKTERLYVYYHYACFMYVYVHICFTAGIDYQYFT